jgi:hypothetical protein
MKYYFFLFLFMALKLNAQVKKTEAKVDTLVEPEKKPRVFAGKPKTLAFDERQTTLRGEADGFNGKIYVEWSKVEGPNSFEIANPHELKTKISNLEPGVYVFELKVTDQRKASGKDAVQITVKGESKKTALLLQMQVLM